jgi:hypothetical protein
MRSRCASHDSARPLNCGVMRRDELSAEPDAAHTGRAPRTRPISLISAAVAIVIGLVAAGSALFYGAQVGAFSGDIVRFVLLPLFGTSCSLAGVLGAVGAWRFKRWGWWLVTWYCVFSIFGAFAPFFILGQIPASHSIQFLWFLFVVGALGYFFMPSVRASYGVIGSAGRAAVVLVGAGFVCTVLLFGYSGYFALSGT